MPRKLNSFSRALSDATQRLEQAQRHRQSTREMLARLELEIPALQRTIAALRSQLNPTPEAKPDGLKDLSGPGSVPIDGLSTAPEWPTSAITDDEALPEIDGIPVTPED